VLVGESYIRASALIGFTDLVEQAGGNGLALLDEAGIEHAALSNLDGLISFRKLAVLMEIAAVRLDRPNFGLEWSLSIENIANHGPIILLASYVQTIEEWFEAAIKYWRFHTNAFTIRLIKDEASQSTVLRYEADSFALPGRQMSETVLANMCQMARLVTDDDTFGPTLVRFQHSQPKNLDLHTRMFRCPIEFNADHTELVGGPELLDRKTNGSLRTFKSLMSAYLRIRIALMPVYDQSMTTTVALAIPSLLGSGRCDMDAVAASLGLNPKRLQRGLADENTNFSEIIGRIRENIARRLLIESDAPVERIAGLLDYSSTAPFTTAFKRWTGQAPLTFRRDERERLAQRNRDLARDGKRGGSLAPVAKMDK
jgi:AraC-like DNA-binding protein